MSIIKFNGRCVLFVFFAFFQASAARCDFLTTLSVSENSSNGLYTYNYILANLSTSDLPVVSISIEVSDNSDIKFLNSPIGWEGIFDEAESFVSWDASGLDVAIMPDQTALFSFTSPLAPSLHRYNIVGRDGSRLEFNQGTIASPGAAAIPEPSSIIILGTGLLVFLGYTRYHCRHLSV